ncbi:hypothetical protein [Legionella septentrionalis]|uniref:Uncharacterized protein n=1 Tax=Legionella septentrionalis TaxID=2498109 RepID=A0A433JMF0_9GAMM|nr:hypothetical protein [Legionella septentrionalis]RUQ91507.1 hypothetical protein EKM59_00135 [Legionella septentrionalis]RUQ98490.1 hypothetical protein ELY11_05545 [Legionella septentrionalis]RUR14593.1 hypothetical protein ELY10_08215 [Legionella septentrionalis]
MIEKMIILGMLLLFWIVLYRIFISKRSRIPKLKATIVVLLFSSLLFQFGYDLHAFLARSLFSLQKEGEVALPASPLRIPAQENNSYCNRFMDQHGQPLTTVSVREGERFCGKFWRLDRKKVLYIPYKMLNDKQVMYWASPALQIIGPKP